MTTAIFTECLRALAVSTGMQGGDILLYANNCAFFSARYVTASEYKVRALSTIISFMRTGYG